MKGKKKSETAKFHHNLGFSAISSINSKVKDVVFEIDMEIEWLHELLYECKKAFTKPDVELLPKTPSVKRRGRRKRPATCSDSDVDQVDPPTKRLSIQTDDGDADVEMASSPPPTRTYRTRGASRTVATTTKPKRTTRTNKTVKQETEPILSMNKYTEGKKRSLQDKNNSKTVETKNEEGLVTPVATTKKRVSKTSLNNIDTDTPKAVANNDVIIQETPEMCTATPVTPVTVKKSEHSIDDTPVNTGVKNSECSTEDTPINTVEEQVVEESPPTTSRKSRTSVRKSLKLGKTLSSSTRLSSIKRMSLLTLRAVEAEAMNSMCVERDPSQNVPQSKVQSPDEKPRRTATKLRLKKNSQNTDSVSSVTSEKSIASVSSHGSVADLDNSTEEEKPQRSTRTKTRIGKTESVSKTRTKTRKKHLSSQLSSADYSDEEVVLISDGEDAKPESNQRLSASNSDDDCAFASEVKTTRTRTKQKNNSNKSSVRVNIKSDNEDSGILSSKSLSETNLPRTRSKMGHSMLISDIEDTKPESNQRLSASNTDDDDSVFASEVKMRTRTRTKQKNNSNKSSVSGVYGDQSDREKQQFVKPEHPPPRTRTKTKKRPLSDDEADMSLSKKNCMDQSNVSDISVGLPVGNSTFMSGKQDEMKTSTDEESNSDYDSPVCSRNKIIRPKPQISSFVHNLNNKIAVSNKPGIVRSFIKRNSPVRKLTPKQIQEQKKKELVEKEKKEQERLHRRHIEMQQKIEEQRRKNDIKMKKAAEIREQRAKRDQEMRDKVMKKLTEKRQQKKKQDAEKAKEDQEKQQLRLKKIQEAEERRRQEEEERQQKIQLQDEESRMMKEFMTRKKEVEEQERQRKIAEEKKRYEERMAALEKVRQEEIEMLKKKEEEREREQQKIKEERERQMVLEKAEREKQAIEQKKQKDQLLKERMEKIKELEKKRLLEEEKRRAELREREEAVKQIINSHNTNIKNTKEEILKAATSSLNSTQTYSVSSKPNNPDSYDMTPAKTYKPSNFITYDISELKSDDSTDDEDAPKKRIPPWASGPNLKAALINQHYHPPDLEKMFDEIIPPDLNEIFIKKKARFNKRTSSAHWDSPILRPGSVVLNW